MSTKPIKTAEFSAHLRGKGIDLQNQKILITNYTGSEQEQDLAEPANCKGFGRIRNFKLNRNDNWMSNPLPIVPVAKALGLLETNSIRAQVFQNSICNWRCWYCFVDFELLSGNPKFSSFLTCNEMLDLYLDQKDVPKVIDLTGGQPDLTPEWVPWMMECLTKRGLHEDVFLWSDDNLSNDYFWKYLTDEQIDLVSNYKMYARVCCFKGIDEQSFALNTKAEPALFDNQFELFSRFHQLGLDLYGYITLTSSTQTDFAYAVPHFLDRIQKINENLPLRIIPLEVTEFKPVIDRIGDVQRDAMDGQYLAMRIWKSELEKRFDIDMRGLPITDVKI